VEPARTRRDQVVEAAADLLRHGGPEALTSVAVAERVGIAQSAVYRHVRTVAELQRLATDQLARDVRRALGSIVVSDEFRRFGDVESAFARVVDAMHEHCPQYDTIDRWRFDDGYLGHRTRLICAEVDDAIAAVLEHHFRRQYGVTTPWTTEQRAVQRAHAELFQREGLAVARLVRSGADRAEAARILRYRSMWAWVAYVVDMHDRLGLELPAIDPDRLTP
jgi:AcrR family transcriptional regulator